MLRMNTLRNRLLEIALDLGEEKPSNRFFERLLKLTSGRVTQILDPAAKTSLGAKSLSQLVAHGYNPSWVSDGKQPKRLSEASQMPRIEESTTGTGSKTVDRLIKALGPLIEQDKAVQELLAERQQLKEHLANLEAEVAALKAQDNPQKKQRGGAK